MLVAFPALAQLPANVYVNSKQFNFAYQTGATVSPQPQTLQVISDPPRNFTVTATLQEPLNVPNWLSVNGGSTTAGTTGQASSFVTVAAVPTGLPAGLYRANIRVRTGWSDAGHDGHRGVPSRQRRAADFLERAVGQPARPDRRSLISPLVVNSTSTAVRIHSDGLAILRGSREAGSRFRLQLELRQPLAMSAPTSSLTANLTGLRRDCTSQWSISVPADLGDVSLACGFDRDADDDRQREPSSIGFCVPGQ